MGMMKILKSVSSMLLISVTVLKYIKESIITKELIRGRSYLGSSMGNNLDISNSLDRNKMTTSEHRRRYSSNLKIQGITRHYFGDD